MRPGRSYAGWRLALLTAVLALPAAGAEERVAVPAGTPVREVASPVGRVLWTVEAAAELPVLDRSGEWVRVAEGERSGWVELTTTQAAEVGRQEDGGGNVDGGDASAAPPGAAAVPEEAGGATGEGEAPAGAPDAASGSRAGSRGGGAAEEAGAVADPSTAVAPTLPPATPTAAGAAFLGGADPADRLLAAARDSLGGEPRELSWGRFAVLTDLPEHPLLAVGERIAAELPALHARRHGFAEPAPTGAVPEGLPAAPASLLVPPPLGTLVLFAREADYRAYLAATAGGERLADDLAGHAAGGVAALPLAGRTAGQAARTLVHELAHLLNRRRWGERLPPWLDEGLAGDLELVEIGDAGGLDAARWASGPPGRDGRRARVGPLVALDRLLADAQRGRLETLAALVALDRPAFAASPRSLERYALAALWVRYLLDDPQRAAAFARFLAALETAPLPPDGGAALLAGALGADLAAHDRPFHLWLRDLARRR